MKVLVTYGRRAPYPPLGVYLVNAFRQLGHQALLLPVRDRPWWGTCLKRLPSACKQRWRWDPLAWANQMTLRAIERYRPDALLEVEGDLFSRATLQLIKQRWGTRLAVWLVEGPLSRGIPSSLSAYDVVMSTSEIAVHQLQQGGIPQARYLPFATDPKWFHSPLTRSNRSPVNIGFIGAYTPKRATYLEAVADLGLTIWGTEWSQQVAPALWDRVRAPRGIFGRQVVRAYQTSRLFVSIQRPHMMEGEVESQQRGTGLSFRHFDAPACGSVLLSEEIVELPRAFVPGEEMETFASAQELREKARYWLTHDEARRRLAQRARARVLQEHTYLHRAQQLLKWFDGC